MDKALEILELIKSIAQLLCTIGFAWWMYRTMEAVVAEEYPKAIALGIVSLIMLGCSK